MSWNAPYETRRWSKHVLPFLAHQDNLIPVRELDFLELKLKIVQELIATGEPLNYATRTFELTQEWNGHPAGSSVIQIYDFDLQTPDFNRHRGDEWLCTYLVEIK